MNEHVKVYDFKLEKVLEEGKFIGINDFGNAILEKDGKKKEVIDGRMRRF